MNWELLSKYRNELYGISIIWIVLFHGLKIKNTALPKLFSFLDPIIRHGNCGVEIFLFLSGVYLFFSLKKSFDIISFYLNRIKRIILPFLFIDGLFWVYHCLYLKNNVVLFIKNITLYSFWSGREMMVWYIALILVLYIVYPLIFKALDSSKYSVILMLSMILMTYIGCVILKYYYPKWFSSVEIALTRIPVFLIGCYVGKLVYEKQEISMFIKLASFVFVVYGLSFFYQHPYSLVKYYRIPYLLVGPSLAIWLSVVLDTIDSKRLNSNLSIWGGLSLELYLMHIVLRKLFVSSNLYTNRVYMNYVWYFIICCCIAFVLCFFVSSINKRILNRHSNP